MHRTIGLGLGLGVRYSPLVRKSDALIIRPKCRPNPREERRRDVAHERTVLAVAKSILVQDIRALVMGLNVGSLTLYY